MGERRLDDATIARYLLGDLSGDDASELEQRYFADPDFLRRIETVEDDLIDGYVRNELAPADRSRFEGHFLLAPRRQERVRMAAALLDRVDARTVPRPATMQRWALPLAAALFGAAMLTIVWLVLANRSLHTRLESMQAAQEEAQRDRAILEAELARRSTAPALPGAPVTVPAPRRQLPLPAPLEIATITLLPGLSRDAGNEIPILRLTPDAKTIRLEALLDADEALQPYRVVLQRGERTLWERSGLVPSQSGGEATLRVTLPRDRFVAGDHMLTITTEDFVADYPFVVEIRD